MSIRINISTWTQRHNIFIYREKNQKLIFGVFDAQIVSKDAHFVSGTFYIL